MKKLLLSSTLLVATAGVAAADVSFSGIGRFGLDYDSSVSDSPYAHQKLRMSAIAKTETTSGMVVSGKVLFDTTAGRGTNTGSGYMTAAAFTASKGGALAEFGFASDVLDAGDIVRFGGHLVGFNPYLNQRRSLVGQDKYGMLNPELFDKPSRQAVRTRYFDDSGLRVSASYAPSSDAYAEYWQAGVGYDLGAHKVGFVYGNNTANGDYWVIGADGRVGDFYYAAIASDSDMQDKVGFGASGGYNLTSATSLRFAVSISGDGALSGSGAAPENTWGIGLAHNLGGGVSLHVSGGQNERGSDVAQIGMLFRF